MGFTSKDLKPLDKKVDTNVELSPQTNIAKKAWGFLGNWFGYVAVIVASIVYLFLGWFDLVEKDATLLSIIASSGIILAFGYFINQFFRLQALLDMAKAPEIIEAEKEHEITIEKASEYLEYSEPWTDEEMRQALKNARTYLMASAGLAYKLYFDTSGNFIGDDLYPDVKVKDKRKRKRNKQITNAINKARYFKITPLTITNLISSESVTLDPHKLGRDKKTYQKMENSKDLVMKTMFALIFGYFGFQIIQGASWAEMMETGLQVVFFYLIGAITYYNTTAYMMGEYRGSVIKKTRYLKKFTHWVTNNLATLKEVKNNGNNGENTTTISRGTQENYSSEFSPNHIGGSTIGSTTTPSVSRADEKAVD